MTLRLAALLAAALGLAGTSAEAQVAVTGPRAESAPGAVLRALDKIAGTHVDLEMEAGETRPVGRIEVHLGECRYPADNPDGDAFAYLEVRNRGAQSPVFEGWMVASSPALNALDHARYDVWVLRCKTS